MLYTIQNEKLTLSVNSIGAELWSLRNTSDSKTGFLWDGAPEIWPRRAPICFPWCGKVENGWFEDRGCRYEAGQHGFVRDLEQNLTRRGNDFLSFRIDWPGDGKRWPWKFSFETRYSLEGDTVAVTCETVNLDGCPMPVQLGFHTGYRCPFSPDGKTEDYAVRFQQPEVPGGGTLFLLAEHAFENGNVLFHPLKSEWVQLEDLKTGRYIRTETNGWPYLLLWSKPGIPGFLCIEPWTGCTGPGHDLAKRPGALLLPSQETLRRSQRISFHIF
jgi:galactose mutarotase-like enzyme